MQKMKVPAYARAGAGEGRAGEPEPGWAQPLRPKREQTPSPKGIKVATRNSSRTPFAVSLSLEWAQTNKSGGQKGPGDVLGREEGAACCDALWGKRLLSSHEVVPPAWPRPQLGLCLLSAALGGSRRCQGCALAHTGSFTLPTAPSFLLSGCKC